jgi:hypothetical protein
VIEKKKRWTEEGGANERQGIEQASVSPQNPWPWQRAMPGDLLRKHARRQITRGVERKNRALRIRFTVSVITPVSFLGRGVFLRNLLEERLHHAVVFFPGVFRYARDSSSLTENGCHSVKGTICFDRPPHGRGGRATGKTIRKGNMKEHHVNTQQEQTLSPTNHSHEGPQEQQTMIMDVLAQHAHRNHPSPRSSWEALFETYPLPSPHYRLLTLAWEAG